MELPPLSYLESYQNIYEQFKCGFSNSYELLSSTIEYLEYIDEYEELFDEKQLQQTLHAIVELAKSGSYVLEENDYIAMGNDIAVLQQSMIYATAWASCDANQKVHLLLNGDINYYYLQCGLWNEIKKAAKAIAKFVKKHKKAIIAGAIVATAASVVIYRITHKKNSHEDSSIDENELSISIEESSIADTVRIEVESEQDSFSISTTSEMIENLSTLQKSKQITKELTGVLCHEVVEEISTLGEAFIQAGNEIKSVAKLLFPEEFIKDINLETSEDKTTSWKELIASFHNQIDRWFDLQSLRTESGTFPLFKDQYLIGELPIPSKAIDNLTKVIKPAQKTKAALEIVSKETGWSIKALNASIDKFRKADVYLKPHKGKWLKDLSARKFIKRAGLTPAPRPKSIPRNFLIKLTDGAGGIEYIHPTNYQHRVRLMPGKPHSENPWQRNPYVKWQKHGQSLDKYGNPVSKSSKKAHIPIEEFTYFE